MSIRHSLPSWFLRPVSYLAALPLLWLSACSPSTQEPAPDTALDTTNRRLEDLTGAHTRMVWLQDAWERNDVFSDRGQLRLMAFDSRDGQGERVLLPGPRPFQKPLIAPCGQQVVFTHGSPPSVWIVEWAGGEERELAPGLALAVWQDPENGTTWVYVAREPTEHRGGAYARLVRFLLHDPAGEEPVWDQAPVGRDNFQLSADGRRAAGVFPWPDCGIANLLDGTWERLGRGCWTSMAPDNRYRMAMLDGAHRNLVIFDTQAEARWQVALAQAPGIEGHEVYHPRWSNHPRFMTITGPYKIRQGGNNIRGGGEAVEVHVGRYSPDFRAIEDWVQVTDNPHANFFPDVWVAPEADRTPDALPPETTGDIPAAAPEIELTARLIDRSPIPAPDDILPYRRSLVANTYEVETVESGELPHPRILIAHWAIWDGQVLPTATREIDRLYHLRVQAYDARDDLEGERLAMDVDDLLLPLYYDLTDEPKRNGADDRSPE